MGCIRPVITKTDPMKKYLLPAIFVLSLAINACFIGMKVINKQRENRLHSLFRIKPVPYAEGLESLRRKLAKEAPQVLKAHDYAFISTWDTLAATSGRLQYLLHLDSLFATPAYAAMDKLLLSEMLQSDIETYMQNNGIRLQSFIPISDADDFISSAYTLRQPKARLKSHPMHAILNKTGELLYFNIRISGIEENDSTLYHIHQIITP